LNAGNTQQQRQGFFIETSSLLDFLFDLRHRLLKERLLRVIDALSA